MRQPTLTQGTIVLAFLILVAMIPMTAFAGGENRAGTDAAPELLIPVGARDLAMGGSSIATTSGIEAIYWNPAGLARADHSANVMFSHMNYIADIGVEYVAVSGAFEGFGTLGFSVKSLSIGNVDVTTADAPDGTGAIINPTVVNLGLTYSRLLTDRVSIGATATLISERFGGVSSSGFAFSAGVQYTGVADVNGLSVGVAVKNIGPTMQFDGDALLRQGNVNDVLRASTFYKVTAATYELPSVIAIGLSYNYNLAENNDLNLSTVFQNNNFSSDEYKVGAEYGFDKTFFVRGGYDFAEQTKNNTLQVSDKTSYIYGFTAGAGIHYPLGSLDLAVDYAYRSVKFLDNNHIITVKIGF